MKKTITAALCIFLLVNLGAQHGRVLESLSMESKILK